MQGNASNSARVAVLCAVALLIFVVWLVAPGQSNVGIAFFYAIPAGMATWWFGRRAGAIAVLACGVLYCTGALIEPVDQFGVALSVRMLAFVGVATLVALLHERQVVLEHSAEELEAIRAALTPAALPQLPGVDSAAAFVPSELGVSGDFYLLGAQAELALSNGEASLASDDGVLVYTDGATDVRQEGELLGLEGLSRLLAPLTKLPAAEIVSQVERAILGWAEKPIQDDLCLLVLKPR